MKIDDCAVYDLSVLEYGLIPQQFQKPIPLVVILLYTSWPMSSGENEVLGKGRFLQLVKKNRWEYCERIVGSGVVLLVAVTNKKELVLVEQYRAAVNSKVLELPAGLVGDNAGSESEAFTQAAKRELLEETGFEAGRLEFLTEGPISSGLTNETLSFYFASDLTRKHAGGGDENEQIQVHVVPVANVEKFARECSAKGMKIDPKIFSALYFAADRLS